MDKSSAKTAVKIIAILYWVGAALGIIAGITMIFGGSFLGSMMPAGGGFMAGLFAIMGFILLVIGIVDIFVGFGLWKFRNWARIVAIVFAVISLLSFPIGTIIGIAIIYLLAFEKTVKSLFH